MPTPRSGSGSGSGPGHGHGHGHSHGHGQNAEYRIPNTEYRYQYRAPGSVHCACSLCHLSAFRCDSYFYSHVVPRRGGRSRDCSTTHDQSLRCQITSLLPLTSPSYLFLLTVSCMFTIRVGRLQYHVKYTGTWPRTQGT